jgi:hypothetical protein
MVELGRVDIATEVLMLSSYLALPREGHLETALHIMGYLRKKHNSRLVFDPTYPEINESDFPEFDWTEFYGDVTEAIPPDRPEPLGKAVDIRLIVDSDHARCKQTHRSRTGFLIHCNLSLIKTDKPKRYTIGFGGNKKLESDRPSPKKRSLQDKLISIFFHTDKH